MNIGMASILVAVPLLTVGCGGSTDAEVQSSARIVVPAVLLTESWQVRLADASERAPFEAHVGWSHLYQRDYQAALAAFSSGEQESLGLARVHLDLAALYRQAALLGSHATQQVYGADRQDADPAEVDYLLGVSLALQGNASGAMEAWSRVEGAEGRLQQSLEAWLGWSQGGAGWPPDQALGAFPDQLGEVIVGTDPPSSALPHYEFEEQTDEARTVKAADPTALFLRSRWHETAARQLVPDSAGILDGFLAPWRLPVEESAVVVPEDMGDGWLFGGFVLTAQDVGFIADASTRGTAALDDWRARSPLAAALVPAIKDDKLIPELALDQAAMLSQQLEAELVKRAGQEEAIHRGFVQLARVGVIRAAMVVADASDQSRDAGILRLNALDRSSGPAADPVFYVSVAAWDTGNRNPLRAQDLLHGLVKRFPAVEISRYPLDAMHIRLSRNAAPATPVH